MEQIWLTILAVLSWLFDPSVGAVLVKVLALNCIDALLGMMVAYQQGKFEWGQAACFLKTNVLLWSGAVILLGLASSLDESIKVFFLGSAIVVITKYLVQDIGAKAMTLVGLKTEPSQ